VRRTCSASTPLRLSWALPFGPESCFASPLEQNVALQDLTPEFEASEAMSGTFSASPPLLLRLCRTKYEGRWGGLRGSVGKVKLSGRGNWVSWRKCLRFFFRRFRGLAAADPAGPLKKSYIGSPPSPLQ